MNDNLDQYWSAYYSSGSDFGLVTSQLLDKILDKVDVSLLKNNLDIGCGTGQLTRELSHRGYRCTGIDISTSAISAARRHTVQTEELQYVHDDIEKIASSSLPSAPYSLITCKLVYAFMQDKPVFLDKVKSLLRDKGMFVIITPLNQPGEDKKPVAVDYDYTLKELSAHFNNIVTIEGVGVTCLVCQ